MPFISGGGGGGGGLPATWAVTSNGGEEINPTDASSDTFVIDGQVDGNLRVTAQAGLRVSPDTGYTADALHVFDAGGNNDMLVITGNTKIGFFNATPVVQPAAPTTLADVIAALKALGLVAT